jgi:DNA-binding NarL/FixJ family response regulator
LFGVGFISSDSSGVDAEAALHAAFHGLFVWDPRLGSLPSAGPVDDGDATSPAVPEAPAADALTRREADVLEYLARGAGNQEIAGALNVSVNTVKFHLSSLYAKLEVSNRTQALREAARRGYLML